MQIDEETPLLQGNHGKKRPTPLPWFQFSIILALRLAESLTTYAISPFAPQVCVVMPSYASVRFVSLIFFSVHSRSGHYEWERE